MKAYKATNKDMQCLEFQFELNKEFIHEGKLIMCNSGFHFCKELKHVFKYYAFTPDNRFFEVEIPDDALVIDDYNKSVTNKIKFIRELSLADIKELTIGECYVDTEGRFHEYGNVSCYNNKKLHRIDGPAFISATGNQQWFQNGMVHREDGPAVIRANGDQYWYQNGMQHRVDGPAIITISGYQSWWQNGACHRVDGPAVIYADGSQQWYQNGKLHREDGPAIIGADGRQEWWQNGMCHREDGPARIFADGSQEWWKHGKYHQENELS